MTSAGSVGPAGARYTVTRNGARVSTPELQHTLLIAKKKSGKLPLLPGRAGLRSGKH
jgi:hypothetical protein